MDTAKLANETLEILWNNYLILSEQVDLESVPPNVLDVHIQQNSPVRPSRIAVGLGRYGYFISAWSLWECYSRCLCQHLPHKEQKARNESTVDWVARSLTANAKTFTDQSWFASANCVRNLIAHAGGRVDGPRGQQLLQRSRTAFPDLDTWEDGYLYLEHEDMAELQIKIDDFIRETA